MKARARAADWLVRVSGWGRVSVHDGHDGRDAELTCEIDVATGHDAETVLALATRWQRARHHGLMTLSHASAASDGRAVRLCWTAPPGSSLEEVAARHGAIDERTVAALAHDLCAALVHAHGRELVVGIVAPQHLYVAPPGSEQIAALRVLAAGLPGLVAAAGHDIGSAHQSGPARMFASIYDVAHCVAPEVAGGREPTPMSDVFALGATLARLLLGQPLFDSADDELLWHEMARGPGPEAAAALHAVAPALAPALLAAVAPSPLQRAGALSDLRVAIAEVLGEQGVARVSIVRGGGPWEMGSPIVALAAWAGSGAFVDRFEGGGGLGGRRMSGVRARPEPSALAGSAGQAPPPDAAMDALARAKLDAALREIDVQRALTQRAAPRRRSVWVDIIVIAIVAVVAGVILWIGAQRRDADVTLRDPARYKPYLRPPEKRPRPHRLSTWPPPERGRR